MAAQNDAVVERPFDSLIIGGGPVGLTAAIYLTHFHQRIALLDAGASRAVLIPLTRNHAGFPDGISGVDLLVRMRGQAVNFSTVITHARADVLSRTPEGFAAQNPKRDDRGEKRSHRHGRRQSPAGSHE